MADHASFVATIRADPDSDTPRLIYADWLEEQGEFDRAEFIRVQCELAQSPPGHTREVEKRLASLRLEWLLDGLPPGYRWFVLGSGRFFISGLEAEGFALEFCRGLLVSMVLRCSDWFQQGPQLVREHLLHTVRLIDWPLHNSFHQSGWRDEYSWQIHTCPVSALAEALFRLENTDISYLFDRSSDAHNVLSRTCLLWAWSQEYQAFVGDKAVARPVLGRKP